MNQPGPSENIVPRKSRPRLKRANIKIDMTPMVDLGFLLICFFIFTTTMSRPRAAELIMPKEGPPIDIQNSKTLTVLLGKENRIYYYHGSWENAFNRGAIQSTNYSEYEGLGNIIRAKQKVLAQIHIDREGQKGLMFIIKASKEASYKNLIDAFDEVLINGVVHYVIVEPTEEELKFMSSEK